VNRNGSVIKRATANIAFAGCLPMQSTGDLLPMQQSDQATLFKAVEMKQVRNESDVGRTR